MESRILSRALISFLVLILHQHQHQHPHPPSVAAHAGEAEPIIKYHNGRLLTGDINLSVLWYGDVAPEAFTTFVKSLKDDGSVSFDPKVAKWWKMVESYQDVATGGRGKGGKQGSHHHHQPPPDINVKVVNTVNDMNFSLGHNFEKLNETIDALVEKATNGKPDGSTLAVIVMGEGVDLACGDNHNTPCYEHGSIGDKQLYIVIKNQLRKCGWICAWPFHKHMMMFQSGVNLVVDPPTWDSNTHLSIIHFASALASTVTNPFGDGFYGDVGTHGTDPVREVGNACAKAFGTGYFPGFTGRVHVDPGNGGTFNAHGVNDTKFLLPGLWNPTDPSTCWTIM